MDNDIEKIRINFDREKWVDDCKFRDREFALREQDQRMRQDELRLKEQEQRYSRIFNPLGIAIITAAIVGVLNIIVASLNAHWQREADATKAENARISEDNKSEGERILESIKTNSDPDKAATNLKFLVDSGLI